MKHIKKNDNPVGTLHATFLQYFGCDDVVYVSEKRCNYPDLIYSSRTKGRGHF